METTMRGKDGLIVFKDTDGNLIMNRPSDTSFWCESFIKISLEADARERGVRVLKSDYDPRSRNKTINCIVDYLKRKS